MSLFLKSPPSFYILLCPAPVGKGAISVAFVCLSVRHIRSKLIIRVPKGLVCRNLERKFPTLEVTLGTILQVR